jgi:hypothetical protein
LHYRIERDAMPLDCLDVIGLWQRSAGFREFFCGLLRDAPWTAFRWETPPLTRATARRPFEFVVLHSPWLALPPDPTDFVEHFTAVEPGEVVSFANLGGDAILVAPSPHGAATDYAHLGAWLRNAPLSQQHALWIAVADAVLGRLGTAPLWLSTAGGGVAWLHVRLDDRPKYYAHAPYRAQA